MNWLKRIFCRHYYYRYDCGTVIEYGRCRRCGKAADRLEGKEQAVDCPHGWAWGLNCSECVAGVGVTYTGTPADAVMECSQGGIERLEGKEKGEQSTRESENGR